MSTIGNGWRLLTVAAVTASLLVTPVVPCLGKGRPDHHDRHFPSPPDLKVTVGRPPLPPGLPIPVPVPRVEVEVRHDRGYYPKPRSERRDHRWQRYDQRRDYYRHYYRPYGRYLPSLPAGFLTLTLGGGLFYYHMGTYYRPSDRGYVVVQAPIGARVRMLPEVCSPLYVDGQRYFVCDDVYYLRDGEEYVVVERPARRDFRVEVGDEVWINADFLNLRSGPGQHHRVVGQLYRGDVVEVGAIEDGWYYVSLPDGNYGWVKGDYATLYRAREEIKG